MIGQDAGLREQLALCHDWGIGHSRFLAMPEADQDKALAYARFRASQCQGCGTRPEEWDPAVGGDENAYAATEHFCPGCAATAAFRERLQRRKDPAHGVYAVLLPKRDAQRRNRQLAQRRSKQMARWGGEG